METEKIELIVEEDHRNVMYEWINEFHFWLTVDGINVAYMKADYNVKNNVAKLSLHDIEVRDGYKGKRLSIEIMNKTAEYFNVDYISHSGGYTPEGFERIFKHVRHENTENITGASFNPMAFVENWDEKTLEYI